MDCTNCGAPLPPKSNICKFCGTLNETDLRAIRQPHGKGERSERPCPRCKTPLHGIELQAGGGLLIDRCDSCMGIFFDPDELETLIDSSVKHVGDVDRERIDTLIREEAPEAGPVRYLPCPDCGKLMNRQGYGMRSGVVVDRCKEHGVWLDGGELGQIAKWIKAGGKKHDQRRRTESELAEEKLRNTQFLKTLDKWTDRPNYAERGDGSGLVEAIDVVMRWIR